MNDLHKLPKIELHVHIDCSLSFHGAQRMIPGITLEQYNAYFRAPDKCVDLTHYLKCAQFAVNLLQSKENLEIAVEDLLTQQAIDGVIYSELRFAPFEHVKKGLVIEEIVETVLKTMKRVSDEKNILSNLILCTLRHYTTEQSLQTARMVEKFFADGVVGLDLASDEARYSLSAHIPAFELMKDAGIPTTAHAGEAVGPESVLETIEKLSPTRIGHGVRAIEDPKVIAKIKELNIHLEVCPSSNIQTNVYDKYSDHVLNLLRSEEISFGINTDARAITNIDLNEEYDKLIKNFGWNKNDFYQCNIQALDHAFLDENLKTKVKKRLIEGYL